MAAASRKSAAPPGFVAPMKAVLAEQLPVGDGWAHEIKWDGMRIVARCRVGPEGSSVTLWSANGRDVTASFPELGDLPRHLGISAVLDGEAVVFDGEAPSFGRLQNRMHVSQPSPRLMADHPVVFLAFDLLEVDGRSLLTLPYRDRRRLLRTLVDDGPLCRVPPASEGDGTAMLDLARRRGLEGVVSKRLDSPYVPGARSRTWLKVKVRQHQELVVGGWLPGRGALAGHIGSLLVGYWHDGELRFSGAVGSGLTDRHRQLLAERFTPRATSPFASVPALAKPPAWVEPDVVVEVAYGEITAEGVLRHPVYLGLRTDTSAPDVTGELPSEAGDVG